MPQFRIFAGCAVEKDLAYFGISIDDLDPDELFSRLAFYDELDPRKWLAHDVRWQVSSVCAWTGSKLAKRVYVALGQMGQVEIAGPAPASPIVEHIAGAGDDRSAASAGHLMTRVRQIGESVYACGWAHAVFRRDPDAWQDVTPVLGGHDRSAEAFFDVNGFDESTVYAVGMNGVNRNVISVRQGGLWRQLDSGVPGYLKAIALSELGGVYFSGTDGQVLYGDYRGIQIAAVARGFGHDLDLYRAAEYEGELYLGTAGYGLFKLAGVGREITPVTTHLSAPVRHVVDLEARDGVLWVFEERHLVRYDGVRWERIVHPDNPPPR